MFFSMPLNSLNLDKLWIISTHPSTSQQLKLDKTLQNKGISMTIINCHSVSNRVIFIIVPIYNASMRKVLSFLWQSSKKHHWFNDKTIFIINIYDVLNRLREHDNTLNRIPPHGWWHKYPQRGWLVVVGIY